MAVAVAVAAVVVVALVAAEAAVDAAAVATPGADNNKQREAKIPAAAMAVGKRRPARGEKRRRRRGRRRRQLVGRGRDSSGGSGGDGGSEVSLTIESENMHEYFRGEGSTFTNWRQFGANKSDASRECPNIRSQCLVWRPNRVLSVPQIDLSARTEDRKMVNLYVYLGNF